MAGRGEDLPSELLRFFDVRLVERVDAEDRTGERRRDLPADALAGEVDRVVDLDADHRLARGGELVEELRNPAARQADPDEGPIRAVLARRATGLEIDRHDARAVLAGRLGEELLQPRTEALDRLVGEERELVASRPRERPDRETQMEPGVVGRGGLPALAEHRRRGGEQGVEVDADERRRDEPDVGQRRVAAADLRRVQEDLAELIVVGDRFAAPARIGDGGEEVARALVRAGTLESGVHARPGVGHEGERLGRRAGLAGHDPEGLERVEVVDGRRDRRRIRGVEDPQVEVAVGGAEDPVEDVGREARPAHAHDHRSREAIDPDGLAEALERRELAGEVLRRVEPAEPVGDRRLDLRVVGPEARVALEEPLRPAVRAGVLDHRVEPGLVLRRKSDREGRAHQPVPPRRSSRSMARTLSSRRRCLGSPLNTAPRKAREHSTAGSMPMTREPRVRTFMSSCSTPWWAEYVSWQTAARTPRILFAATEAPTPDPQIRMPRSAAPSRTV